MFLHVLDPQAALGQKLRSEFNVVIDAVMAWSSGFDAGVLRFWDAVLPASHAVQLALMQSPVKSAPAWPASFATCEDVIISFRDARLRL